MIFEKDWEKNLNKIDKALTKESHKLIAQMFYDIARINCAEIAEALDSGRGNEKEIAKAIRSREA